MNIKACKVAVLSELRRLRYETLDMITYVDSQHYIVAQLR